jgi:hypothetical protein
MRDYGKVFSRIWESATFRALSEDGRTLALYLLTCQHGTIAGAFRMPDGYACEDMQWESERVRKGFENLTENGFAYRCEATKWVWIVNYLGLNPPENPNQRKSAAKVASSIPGNCSWQQQFINTCGTTLGIVREPLRNPSDTVPDSRRESGTGVGVGTGVNSVPDGTEAGASPSAEPKTEAELTRTELWRAGKSLLAEQGMPKAQCGTFVGRLVSGYGDEVVVAAVRSAVVQRPADAASYLTATCQRLKGERADGEVHPGYEDRTAALAAEAAREVVPAPASVRAKLAAAKVALAEVGHAVQ